MKNMSFVKSKMSGESGQKFIESLQSDFRLLGQEAKKRYPQIKESCEEAISKLNNNNPQISAYYVVNQILYPLVQGCETKDTKIIKFCLGMIQRLITQQVVDQKGARYITDALWMLMENNIEEVKVLQTVTLLLTTNSVVRGETLAKSLVLCFRLHFSKNSTIVNTAGATIRQLVSLVFERVLTEQELNPNEDRMYYSENYNVELNKTENQSCAADAFLLFQDLIQLVNADQPYWLLGMTEMTRTFGLELLEAILANFVSLFYQHGEFTSLLKERVCALVIKLFSPNVKHRSISQSGTQAGTSAEKPYFPISIRLLRLVSVLVQKYHQILVTECEIFLSLIIKFLDTDKPLWQRALALEVIHKLVTKPDLIVFFCKFYDSKDHATNIFQDMINSLGTFIQNLLINTQPVVNIPGQQPTLISTPCATSGMSPSQGFVFRGVWIPLITSFTSGQAKATYLEMLEKMEPPSIPEGYCVSLAYSILLDIMRSVSHGIQSPDIVKDDDALKHQLINSSWGGLLTAIMPLADAATDETMVGNILKAMENYVALCGALKLYPPRDAFITAICRASLPHHYALSLLNAGCQITALSGCHTRTNSQELSNQFVGHCNENDFRQQIVAVGTPLPTASSIAGTQQGPVMLTAKNLYCMKALLHLAHCHGDILGTSWHIVLATLQHLVWILGLKPSTGGSLQAAPKPTIDTNAGIQTAVMADLPVLSQMLSQLFESSQYLDDVALHHLIDALCKLSQEAMELAYTNREPSLFAVAKLLETGIVNLPRIEVLWRPLTNHLLEVCQHRHIRMREWGVEAITYLVRAALQFKYNIPLKENMDLQTLLLNPLAELSTVPHGDVRQRQLECVLQILNGAGDNLSFGWPSILDIIGAVDEHQGEALIRTAFQCLQLVITDFLQIMPLRCLPLCVNVTAKFGRQTQELNISLTAVGLMWNISDHFNQNQDRLLEANIDSLSIFPEFPGIVSMPQFDKLWMCLYTKLGDLCVDLRPAVRKSASQTLFSTISAHGSLLSPPTWRAVLWHVLFPLLDKVRDLSSSASNEKVDTTGNILIHHTRNTAQKQWAETQVLTLSGVSRVFNTKRDLLRQLGDFIRAWALLLEFIEDAALSRNNEVSLAAMKSFQEIIYIDSEQDDERKEGYSNEIWDIAWKAWLKIGMECTECVTNSNANIPEDAYIPTQAFLTALVQIFPALFQHVRDRFTHGDFEKLCTVLMNAVIMPVHSDVMPYILSTTSDSLLCPLHDCILECMELLQKEATSSNSNMKNIIPSIFKQLLNFSKLSCVPPMNENIKIINFSSIHSNNSGVEWVTVNYIPFGEKALNLATKLYQSTAADENVIKGNILHEIIKALHIPLSLKYKCMSPSTWKLAISSLLTVLKTGLKVARTEPNYFTLMWDDLSEALDKFLFPSSRCNIEDRGLEEIVLDETIDCQVIELLRDEVLPFSNEIPQQFILNIVVLLNKGSIHSTSDSNLINESEWKLREMFAKICFETLLQFSLLDDYNNSNNGNRKTEENDFAGRLAVTALLHRFQEVLKRFNDDERQSGKCPLPRYRLSEISFVLKAVATLVVSMKKASPSKVNKTAWEQLIALYPYLVDCTTTSSTEVSRSLREALLQYADLLQTPKGANFCINDKNSLC